jgi:hypothetical protein
VELIPVTATVRCGHDGLVQNVAGQRWVSVSGAPLLVDADPEGRTIGACPNYGPTMKPCARTLRVIAGYSSWLRIGGQRIVLSTLDGLTDGTVPGTVHYTVRDPAQRFVRSDG